MISGKHWDVIASGYVSMDRIIKLKTPIRTGFTSLVANKTSADIQYGGCSVNIAHNLCRLGRKALPVMRVGGDWDDIGFRSFLWEAGIPLDALSVMPEERTSLCYLLQDGEGRHTTLFYPGAMNGAFARPMTDAWFEGSRLAIMTVGSCPDNEMFFDQCKKHGLPLVFSAKGDADAFPRGFLHELLHYCRIIFSNEIEREAIESMFGESMENLVDNGRAEYLVTTLGREGSRCYYREGGVLRRIHIPACDLGPPVDTTGSGDGYVSGFLYGYLNGRPPRECALLGTVLASFIIEREGCCAGAPDEAALTARYTWFDNQLQGG